jgi:hypothetical protein
LKLQGRSAAPAPQTGTRLVNQLAFPLAQSLNDHDGNENNDYNGDDRSYSWIPTAHRTKLYTIATTRITPNEPNISSFPVAVSGFQPFRPRGMLRSNASGSG